ncbi:6518_t:CDS:2 [Racocetra fulgida]|uniref:6518_t:CDS:1 n=1 Tax=Racocetra fulgida TaxID=60492 RepID=A0A9N9BFU6_9GLOM|nr:6518_t:CDS:2 [Racocetra fulgida]
MEILEDTSTATTIQNKTSEAPSAVSTSNTTDEIFVTVEEEDANKYNQTINLVERSAITTAILIPFSIIGVLIRIGLVDLHTYQNAPVFALIYPQFVGSVIGITIGMSIVGLKFGEHLADAFMVNQITPKGIVHKIIIRSSNIKEFTRRDWVCVVSGCVSSVLIIALAVSIQVQRRVLYAAVFAPIDGNYPALIHGNLYFLLERLLLTLVVRRS